MANELAQGLASRTTALHYVRANDLKAANKNPRDNRAKAAGDALSVNERLEARRLGADASIPLKHSNVKASMPGDTVTLTPENNRQVTRGAAPAPKAATAQKETNKSKGLLGKIWDAIKWPFKQIGKLFGFGGKEKPAQPEAPAPTAAPAPKPKAASASQPPIQSSAQDALKRQSSEAPKVPDPTQAPKPEPAPAQPPIVEAKNVNGEESAAGQPPTPAGQVTPKTEAKGKGESTPPADGEAKPSVSAAAETAPAAAAAPPAPPKADATNPTKNEGKTAGNGSVATPPSAEPVKPVEATQPKGSGVVQANATEPAPVKFGSAKGQKLTDVLGIPNLLKNPRLPEGTAAKIKPVLDAIDDLDLPKAKSIAEQLGKNGSIDPWIASYISGTIVDKGLLINPIIGNIKAGNFDVAVEKIRNIPDNQITVNPTETRNALIAYVNSKR
ncbi:MAG: hypothetical protein WC527_08100 [Candidatus Margulisiibacteriota bacterium]